MRAVFNYYLIGLLSDCLVNKFRDYSNRLRGTNSIDRTIDLSQTAFTSDIEDLNRSAALHPDNDTPLPLDKKEVVAAPPTGYMFGKGIYLADMSSKSASYCYPGDSGGEALLLLCEAELGNPCQMLKDADCNAAEKAKKQGMYTTQGLGLIGPNKWMDAGAIHQYLEGVKMPEPMLKRLRNSNQSQRLNYNEYICYDPAQVKLRYLLHVKI